MNNKFTVNDLNLYYGDFHALKNILRVNNLCARDCFIYGLI